MIAERDGCTYDVSMLKFTRESQKISGFVVCSQRWHKYTLVFGVQNPLDLKKKKDLNESWDFRIISCLQQFEWGF